MADSHDITAGEIWKPVVGFEGRYEVSNQGRVRALPRFDARGHFWPGRLKKQVTSKSGHKLVGLGYPSRPRLVHRLMLAAFVGPCPEGMEGCHRDGNPANNRLENIRWDTRAANVADAIRHGTATINENNGNAILTNEIVREIKRQLRDKTNIQLGKMYGVARQTIHSIRRGDSWRRV
jgi:hypothetical protein